MRFLDEEIVSPVNLEIQNDFIRTVIENSLHDFEDQRRCDLQKFYASYLRRSSQESETIDELLKRCSSTVKTLSKENETLKRDNEFLKFKHFGGK